MFVDLPSLLESDITVFHRVREDGTEEDLYRPTVYEGVNVQRSDTRTVDADGTVHDTIETEVRIPSDAKRYSAPDGSETTDMDIDTGDIVFESKIPITGALTRSHVVGMGLPFMTVAAVEDLRSDALGDIGGPVGRYASEVWITCR